MSTPEPKSGVIAGGGSIEHRGVTYRLGKVGISELRELESYLRREPIEAIAPVLPTIKDAETRQMLINGALAQGADRLIGTKAFNEMVQSMTGVIHLMWISLRQHHQMSRKQVEDLFQEMIEEGISEDAKARLFEASGFEAEKKVEGEEQTPTKMNAVTNQ